MDEDDDEYRDRRRRRPFDFIDNDEFDRLFDEVRRMFENTDLREMIDEMLRGGMGSNKKFIHGFSINVGPDGKPKLQEFGNKSIKTPEGEPIISDEREPLTDIIEGDEDVSITVEIPGVERDDINLDITRDNLEIKVDTPNRKYQKNLTLPCDVLPKTTTATYKNGILDIVIKRKEKKKQGEGYHVNIE